MGGSGRHELAQPFRDGRFLTYTTQEGLAGDSVYSVWQRRDGSIWAGSDGGLSEFNNGRFTTYTNALFKNRVTAIMESRDGSLWFGTGEADWAASRTAS